MPPLKRITPEISGSYELEAVMRTTFGTPTPGVFPGYTYDVTGIDILNCERIESSRRIMFVIQSALSLVQCRDFIAWGIQQARRHIVGALRSRADKLLLQYTSDYNVEQLAVLELDFLISHEEFVTYSRTNLHRFEKSLNVMHSATRPNIRYAAHSVAVALTSTYPGDALVAPATLSTQLVKILTTDPVPVTRRPRRQG